jgi:hypothetical protein
MQQRQFCVPFWIPARLNHIHYIPTAQLRERVKLTAAGTAFRA